MTFTSTFMLRLKKIRGIISHPTLLRALLQYRVMAGVEHSSILDRRLATVVDIGANRGQFALAARAITDAKIISFEPLLDPARVFNLVHGGDKYVTLHIAAVGPHLELRKMHVSARDDSSSLLPIADLQSKLFPGTAELATVDVKVGPLDAFVRGDEIIAPAMLKLDVQGFEYEALSGCESLLNKFDFIYCECSFVELYSGQKLAHDVIEWLHRQQFELIGVFNTAYDSFGQAIQADFLFKRHAS